MDRTPRLDDLIDLVRSTAADDDPIEQLRTAAALKTDLDELTDALLGHFVDQARRAGASWSQIGEALGVSKQAVQQKHTSSESVARRLLAAAREKASDGFRRFTPRAKAAVVAAQQVAAGAGASEIGSEHLLVALYADGDSIAAKVLVELGLDASAASAAALEGAQATTEPVRGHLPFTTGAQSALEGALVAALELGHNYIGTEHMLLGLLSLPAGERAVDILAGAGITAEAVTDRIQELLARHLAGGASGG
jgi:hypothetical protein